MDIDRELEELAALSTSPTKLAESAPRLLALARTAREEELRRTRQLRLVFDLTHAVSDAREVAPLVERVLATIHGAMSVDTALLARAFVCRESR